MLASSALLRGKRLCRPPYRIDHCPRSSPLLTYSRGSAGGGWEKLSPDPSGLKGYGSCRPLCPFPIPPIYPGRPQASLCLIPGIDGAGGSPLCQEGRGLCATHRSRLVRRIAPFITLAYGVTAAGGGPALPTAACGPVPTAATRPTGADFPHRLPKRAGPGPVWQRRTRQPRRC